MKSLLRFCLVIAAFGLISTAPSRAGTAFFSADGKVVTFLPRFKTGVLMKVDVASGKLTEVPLPKELKGAAPDCISRGGEGETLLAAGTGVWVIRLDGSTKRLCDLGPVKEPSDLFVAVKPGTPVTDWLFLSAADPEEASRRIFFARKPGGKVFEEIFCRRVQKVDAGCFSEEGRLFFAADGDLWEGGFAAEEDPGIQAGILVGARLAPIGVLNTDLSNSGSLWVDSLAPAGKWIYAGLRGHHMGCIMRVAIPAKPLYNEASTETPEPQAQLEGMRAALAGTEILVADTGSLDAFTACEVDGKAMVFYRGDNDEQGLALWLWTGKGAPRRLATEPKE